MRGSTGSRKCCCAPNVPHAIVGGFANSCIWRLCKTDRPRKQRCGNVGRAPNFADACCNGRPCLVDGCGNTPQQPPPRAAAARARRARKAPPRKQRSFVLMFRMRSAVQILQGAQPMPTLWAQTLSDLVGGLVQSTGEAQTPWPRSQCASR